MLKHLNAMQVVAFVGQACQGVTTLLFFSLLPLA